MVIEWPQQFNGNEIMLLVSVLLVLTICALLPARFSTSQAVYILVFNFFLGVVVDQILAVPPYDFYDIMDVKKMDIMDLVIYSLMYPFTMYLFAFVADLIGLRRRGGMVLFVIGWSAAILGMEWLASQVGVYQYQEWNYGWSAMSYVVIASVNLWVLRRIGRLG